MTADQVKYLKEQLNADNGKGKPIANSVFYDLDNGMAFRNNGDFVIFDDTNELIHCIAANRNNYIKQESPYCMYSASYEMLQFTEANLTLEGLKTLLNGMLTGITTDAQKNQIIKWAEALPVNPISTVVSSYHKEPNPVIPQKPLTVITHPDGVSNGYPVNGEKKETPIKTVSADKAVESIADAKDNSSTYINGSDPITDVLDLKANNYTIAAKGLPITNAVSVSGNGVTMKGFDLTNENLEGEYKEAHILTITGDDFTMENCRIADAGVKTRTGISSNAEVMTIKNCVFDGDGKIYNMFESAYGSAKCKDILFENCTFKEGASNHNFVSFYEFVDGATITFNKCSFSCGPNTNAIRLSNLKNTRATVNIIDCKYETKALNEYAGVVLLQDSSSDKSQDMSLITINFVNLTDFSGKQYIKNGKGKECLWYTYNSDDEPVVTIS